jgi:DNA-binding LytR/AlgR family response regulator
MPTALIAEDEPLLAQALQAELARAWPALQVLACAGDGLSAADQALALQPDVLFFDIRMPGLTGLEAAALVAEDWPVGAGAAPFPLLVFVTAYDQYAVQAFEAQAVDYLLKPVQTERLQKTVAKLQQTLQLRHTPSSDQALSLDDTLRQLRALLQPGATPSDAPLTALQASVGSTIHMVPLDNVVYLEAADKYVRVLTPNAEYLLRTPLKELLPRLDAQRFWQVHRSTVVRANAIRTVQRDEAGKLSLTLDGRKERLAVSRLYAHQFRAM